jgi:hypothetical protein
MSDVWARYIAEQAPEERIERSKWGPFVIVLVTLVAWVPMIIIALRQWPR